MEEFSKELGYLSKEKASGRATGMMPEDACNKTVQEVMKLKGVSKNRVMALVSGLMQNGGSKQICRDIDSLSAWNSYLKCTGI